MPTNFFQNDEVFREQILGGAFTQPFERRINRVDVRDVGVAAARACIDATLPSGVYPLVGPESLDASTCANVWSRELGRVVRYQRDAERRLFDAGVRATLTGKKRDDFLASYTALSKIELPTRAVELARTTRLLGRPPTSYREYVRDTAHRWQSSTEEAHAAQ
jgi:uncharacterized protein YbjT (DUF2867 family)